MKTIRKALWGIMLIALASSCIEQEDTLPKTEKSVIIAKSKEDQTDPLRE